MDNDVQQYQQYTAQWEETTRRLQEKQHALDAAVRQHFAAEIAEIASLMGDAERLLRERRAFTPAWRRQQTLESLDRFRTGALASWQRSEGWQTRDTYALVLGVNHNSGKVRVRVRGDYGRDRDTWVQPAKLTLIANPELEQRIKAINHWDRE